MQKNSIRFDKIGSGKTIVSGMVVEELTRPQGTWKEYWTKHLERLSPNNRLPRGFESCREKYLLRIDPDDSRNVTYRQS
jgi:hypothetical protein